MRRQEKHACGGVVDVTLLSLPFLLEDDDDEEEEVTSSSSVDTSILYTENCNVYTPHFTLRPEGEHASVLCHSSLVFVFCFLFFVFCFLFLFFGTAAKEKEKKKKLVIHLQRTHARTHARARERTHHSPNAHKNVVESTGGDIERFFVAQRR